MVTELATRADKLTDGEQEYFSVLVDLMAAYEKEHKTVRREKMTSAEVLKALLDEHGLTQKALAERVNITRTAL
ncbi:MAG TPA: helix-turn-helix transcriptional regulator, partial [Candidatus Obscuribacterales bacterium]